MGQKEYAVHDKPKAPSHARIVAAGLVGNVLEWYDFAIYGYFASIIGHLFFPSADPSVSLIAAFGAFAAGFLVRPLGGLVFGRIGDLVGRKNALTLSVLAMAVPTVLIGLLPTYEMIGIAAPIAIVVLRIVQGLSVGGEYTTSLIFLAEHAPKGRRAFNASWGIWGASAGILLGSGVGAIMTSVFDSVELIEWVWRIPFLLGGFVALNGYLIRHALHVEPPVIMTNRPVLDALGKHRGAVLRVAMLDIGVGVGFYTAFVFSVTYIKLIDDLPARIAFNLNTAAMALLLLLVPLAAWFADLYGRKPFMIAGNALLAFGAIPFFHLMHTTDPATIFLGEVGLVLAVALVAGGLVCNVELIPKAVRCTGLAFAYNGAIGYFGGTTPMISTWLIKSTGDPIAPAYWLAFAGVVSLFVSVFLIRETKDDPFP